MTGTSTRDLWSLLKPVGKAAFVSEYWERNWLHIVGAVDDVLEDLVGLGELEQLLFDADGSKHAVYAVGEFLSAKGKDSRPPSGDLIDGWFRGRTLVFQDLDRRLPSVSDLARRWEVDLSCRLRCNLYLTPPRAQGFQTHYDSHDVFVLQVIGEKLWRIGRPVIDVPLPTQSCDPATLQMEEDADEVTLRPGDLLYLPGGWTHNAQSGTEISCHITFGLVSQRYLDLIQASAAAAALRDPQFRHQLPIDAEPALSTILGLLSRINQNDLESALHSLREKEAAQQPRPTQGLLGLIDSIGAITEDDVMRANPSARPRISLQPGGIELHAHGKCRFLLERYEPAVRYCIQGQPFTVASIPGEIGIDDKCALVRRLLIEGILIKAGHP